MRTYPTGYRQGPRDWVDPYDGPKLSQDHLERLKSERCWCGAYLCGLADHKGFVAILCSKCGRLDEIVPNH